MPEMTTENKFRSALHGFNRDDVVSYLDRLTKAHASELQTLRGANDQLRAQLEQKSHQLELTVEQLEAANSVKADLAEMDQLRSDNLDLQEKNTRLQEQIDTLEHALEQAESRLQEEMERAEAERASLREQAQEEEQTETPTTEAEPNLADPLPPVAEAAPEDLAPKRDYTELELAAYRRAEMAERLARERACEVYRQVSSVFSQGSVKLDAGKTDLEQMTKTLRENAAQLLAVLGSIERAYGETELSFAEVSEKNKVPEDLAAGE